MTSMAIGSDLFCTFVANKYCKYCVIILFFYKENYVLQFSVLLATQEFSIHDLKNRSKWGNLTELLWPARASPHVLF